MRRRDFITGIAGSSVAWPFVAHAEVSTKRTVIAVLSAITKESNSPLNAFVQGLKEFGYVDGVDVDVVFRVYYKRVDESVGTYSMDHTGAIYLMDKTGQFTASLSFKTEDSVAIERLRSLATS